MLTGLADVVSTMTAEPARRTGAKFSGAIDLGHAFVAVRVTIG